MEFSKKTVLVTGGNGGIGRALIKTLGEAGANVAAADFGPKQNDAKVYLPGDLLDHAYADSLPQTACNVLGSLDIVINNAGVITRGSVTETTDTDWAHSVGVNLEAPFRICRSAIPIMASQGQGVIVNIASCWGLRPGPDHAVYCMSKAALASLTQCMGRDHAHQGIRINAVCPNEVNTPMLRSGFSKRGLNPHNALENLSRTIPLGRVAEPAEIADVVLFLASDKARYICGALVEVNGGKPVA